MMEISEKEFNIADLSKVVDPDFAKLRKQYYLFTKEVTQGIDVLFNKRKVVVSSGEWGGWVLYFCISNEEVVYIGNSVEYGNFWFLTEVT